VLQGKDSPWDNKKRFETGREVDRNGDQNEEEGSRNHGTGWETGTGGRKN
jgi:hypothetical protein